MTRDEFLAHLDRHGPDPECWPRERRDAARRLLAADPMLRMVRDTAWRVDAVLRTPPLPASAALRARILAATTARPPDWPVRFAIASGLLASAASLLVGFYIGASEVRLADAENRLGAIVAGLEEPLP